MSSELIAFNSDSRAVLSWESEGGGLAASISPSRNNKPGRFAKLRNDNGIAEIQIGMKEFECIGASPPHDHPHIYLNMGFANAILCPYCATAFRFAPTPDSVTPIDCLFR